MNKNVEKLSTAIDMVDEKYLTEAVEYQSAGHRIRHTKLLIVAVIAAVSVLLMGAGVLVSRDGIAEWLKTEQEIITGREISDEVYEGMIESEQYIGTTESADDLTITVDSATITDFRINALLKVEGSDEQYPLEGCTAKMYSSSIDFASGGLSYDGVHSDGATYYVARTTYDYIGDPDTTELDVTLKITKGQGEDETEICSIDFTVERVPSTTIEVIPEGESVTVSVSMRYMDWAQEFATDGVINEIYYDLITRDVTAISLSEGGMYITYDNDTAILPDTFGVDKYYIDTEYDGGFDSIYIVMNDGTIIKPVEGGTTESVLGQPVITWRYVWSATIDIDNVAYIQIGYTDIPVVQD
ncbi:MAG: hypothetical protein LUF29_03555 [Oscillospiraceae bacterium]|nr:hypothetical protein [Oscillospiraceae bacterium]